MNQLEHQYQLLHLQQLQQLLQHQYQLLQLLPQSLWTLAWFTGPFQQGEVSWHIHTDAQHGTVATTVNLAFVGW